MNDQLLGAGAHTEAETDSRMATREENRFRACAPPLPVFQEGSKIENVQELERVREMSREYRDEYQNTKHKGPLLGMADCGMEEVLILAE